MATNPTTATRLSIDALRHRYARVSNHGPQRLTVTTFLGGFTLGAFAALLTADPLKDLDKAQLSGVVPPNVWENSPPRPCVG